MTGSYLLDCSALKALSKCTRACLQGEATAGVKEYVEERGLAQISDPQVIGRMLDSILEGHPEQLAQFRSGKTKIQGFFSGYGFSIQL